MLKAIYATFWLFLWVSWTGTSSMVNALEIVPPPTMSRPKSSCWCLPTPHLPSELLGSGGLLINGLKSNPPLSFASLQELLGGLGCVCANPIWQNHTLTDLALNYTSCVDWQTEGNGLWLVRVNGSRCLTSLMMPKLWLISAGREVMNMVSILPGPIVRILRDSGNLFSGLLETWIVALLTLSRDLLATLIGLLETLYIHYSVASLWGAFYVLTSHPRRFIMTGMLTAFICWAKEVTFSRLLLNWYMVPMKIMTLSLTLMMKILSNLMGRIWKMIRVPVDVCERLLDAWPRTRISAIPPKGVIVRFEDDFGHVGFGSCIRVACLKGIYCWVPKHVLDYSTTIRGPKGSMSVTLMRPFYEDFTGDSILLRGPDNWNSNLGLKPADVLPITRARRGSTKFYIEREVKEGQGFTWFCQTADLYEMYKGFIRVGVESEPGDSGLPYFSGNKIVAMHVGAYGDINENKATFLVEIPGITGPAYLVESAHTETRLLTLAEDIAEGEELLARVVKIAGTNYQVSLNNTVQKRLGLAYKPKGRHWGDVSDDEDDDSYKDDILRTFGALEKTYDRKSRSEPPKFESENFRTLEEKNGTNDVRPDPTKPEDLNLRPRYTSGKTKVELMQENADILEQLVNLAAIKSEDLESAKMLKQFLSPVFEAVGSDKSGKAKEGSGAPLGMTSRVKDPSTSADQSPKLSRSAKRNLRKKAKRQEAKLEKQRSKTVINAPIPQDPKEAPKLKDKGKKKMEEGEKKQRPVKKVQIRKKGGSLDFAEVERMVADAIIRGISKAARPPLKDSSPSSTSGPKE
nr:P1 protein [raspberry enamovirus 1]